MMKIPGDKPGWEPSDDGMQGFEPSEYIADTPFAENRWKNTSRLAERASGEGDILVLAVLPDGSTAPQWMERAPVVREPLVVGDSTYIIRRKRYEPSDDGLDHYVVYCELE